MKYEIRYKNGMLYYIENGIAYKDLGFTQRCDCPKNAYLIRDYDSCEKMRLNALLLQNPSIAPAKCTDEWSRRMDEMFISLNGYIKEGWENNDDPIGFNF